MTTKTDANSDRRIEILRCGLSVLIEKGWRGTSMIAIARKASASKETLHNWFGGKAGFFGAMIRQNATALDEALPRDFAGMDLEDGLRAFGNELLSLVSGEASVALNRAAIAEAGSDPALGRLLIEEGKAKSLPKFAGWLARHLAQANAAEAAERFVVLVKGEHQIERLLGVAAPLTANERTAQVDRAVRDFLRLYGPG